MGPFKDVGVEKAGHVALVEIRRPPHNFFDVTLIRELASAFESLDADPECRALVLLICISRATGFSAPKSRSSPPFTAPPLAAAWAWRWSPICA